MSATVSPSKIEAMAQAIQEAETELQDVIAKIDATVGEEYQLRQENFLADPQQRTTGATSGIGQVEDRRRRLEGRRNQLIRQLDAARPVYERERQPTRSAPRRG
jgi:hypothetical protein